MNFTPAIIIMGIALIGLSVGFFDGDGGYYNKVVHHSELNADDVSIAFISSTEYTPRDANGTTIIKLLNQANNFINTTCYETILFPNRSTYIPFTVMSQDFTFGNYFLNFEVPDTLGVYDQEIFCEVNNKNVSAGKSFHISNLSNEIKTRIQISQNNLSENIQQIMNALNCSLTPNVTLCNLLGNLNASITSTIISVTNISDNITQITDIVVDINGSVNTIFFEINAPNCIVGSQWNFSARVTDETDHLLPFLDCTLVTTRFGTETVDFNQLISRYQRVHNCTAPSGTVNWTFNCVKDY